MKIMLVCASGMSTSILMKKIEKYAKENRINLEKIVAKSISDYEEVAKDFDVILLGPQISYKKADIQKRVGNKPVAVIAPQDYALGNAEKIFAQVNTLLGK